MPKKNLFSIILSLFFYFSAILIAKNDPSFSHVWLTFSLWILAILTAICLNCFNQIKRPKISFLFFIIFLSTLITRFLFLKNYPFAAIFDEVRDGGLNAFEIITASIRNIHGYGRYGSHGLIIPTITSFFYLIFKNSVLTYRFPAALIATLDITLIFFLIKKIFNQWVAFLAALIMICSPMHLFYSRTEIVIIFSSLFASLILLGLHFFLENQKTPQIIFLSVILGFSFGLHADVKAFALWTLIFLFLFLGYQLIKQKGNPINIILAILFFLVGFGPRLLFTNPKILFNTSRLPILQTKKINLSQKYLDSMAVYSSKPIDYHYSTYPNKKPILSPLVFIFFIIGILQALILSKKLFFKIIILYVFLIPLTNSALTDKINAGNRLITLLPVSALIFANGIYWFNKKLKFHHKRQKIIFFTFFLFLSGYLSFQAYEFFNQEAASKLNAFEEYLSMEAIYSTKKILPQDQICFIISPQNFQAFKLLHFQEQRQFFLPQFKSKKISQNQSILENQVYISKDCQLSNEKNFFRYSYCQPRKKFICPLNNYQKIEILVEKTLINRVESSHE